MLQYFNKTLVRDIPSSFYWFIDETAFVSIIEKGKQKCLKPEKTGIAGYLIELSVKLNFMFNIKQNIIRFIRFLCNQFLQFPDIFRSDLPENKISEADINDEA